MPELVVSGRVFRVGNSLALRIPAKQAREAGVQEGQDVQARIEARPPPVLGLLADLPYRPFRRHEENLWRE